MKLGINIVAILIALMGGFWFLQGIGVIPVGFMANDSKWAIIGIVCVLVAVGLLVYNNRRKIQA
jgi:hypothetical protein